MPKSRKSSAEPIGAKAPPTNGSTGKISPRKLGPKPRISGPNRPVSEDLHAQILQLLSELLVHPDAWLSTPNVQFGGRSPASLLGTAEESKVFDLLNAYDHGLF